MLHRLGPERQRSASLEGLRSGTSPLTCWGLDGGGTWRGRGPSLPAQAVPPGAGCLQPPEAAPASQNAHTSRSAHSIRVRGRQAGSAASTGHHFEPRRCSCGGIHSGSPRLSPPGAERLEGTSGAQVGGELTTVVASGRLPCDAPLCEAEAGSRGPQVPSVQRVACGRWAPAPRTLKAALCGTSCQPSRPGDGTVARVGGSCSWTQAWPAGRTPQSPRLRGHPSTGHISVPPAARGAHILCLVIWTLWDGRSPQV